MRIDRSTWPQHSPWALLVLTVAAVATAWYFHAAQSAVTWPGGSSAPGFTFGVIGGLIMIFELLLWWRKRVRTWRIGRVQVWMRAHIWLGLLLVPLIFYHSGFRFGGTLTTVLMVLFILVILSGIWGFLMQQLLPRRMLDEVPAETIYSQIDHVVSLLVADADRLVTATCGPADGEAVPPQQPADAGGEHLTIGAVRTAGLVQGRVVATRAPTIPVPGSEPLRHFYRSTVRTYLEKGERSGSPLQSAIRAGVFFRDIKTRLDPAAHDAVDSLQGMCDQRRQFDHQARLHFWLHNWLWIHLPLSVALIVLMFWHIVVALKYW